MYRTPILHLTIGGHMPLVDLYLLLRATRDCLGLGASRCPYCARDAIADTLAADNPRFDRARFDAATEG